MAAKGNQSVSVRESPNNLAAPNANEKTCTSTLVCTKESLRHLRFAASRTMLHPCWTKCCTLCVCYVGVILTIIMSIFLGNRSANSAAGHPAYAEPRYAKPCTRYYLIPGRCVSSAQSRSCTRRVLHKYEVHYMAAVSFLATTYCCRLGV